MAPKSARGRSCIKVADDERVCVVGIAVLGPAPAALRVVRLGVFGVAAVPLSSDVFLCVRHGRSLLVPVARKGAHERKDVRGEEAGREVRDVRLDEVGELRDERDDERDDWPSRMRRSLDTMYAHIASTGAHSQWKRMP